MALVQIRDPSAALLAKMKRSLRNVTPGTNDEEHRGVLDRVVVTKRGATSAEDQYAVIYKDPDAPGRQLALRMSGAEAGALIQHLCAAQR